jgi:hypothetical protein
MKETWMRKRLKRSSGNGQKPNGLHKGRLSCDLIMLVFCIYF